MPNYSVDHVRWLRSQAILRHRLGDFVERDILNAIVKELEDLRQQTQGAERDRDKMQQYFDDLRDLCGYIEDGSSVSISICQDEATKDWTLWIKDRKQTLLFSPTFSGLIQEVHKYNEVVKQHG